MRPSQALAPDGFFFIEEDSVRNQYSVPAGLELRSAESKTCSQATRLLPGSRSSQNTIQGTSTFVIIASRKTVDTKCYVLRSDSTCDPLLCY
jgi:hypothetical protein